MDCGDNAGYRRKTRQCIVEQSGGDNTCYRGKPRRGVVEQGALSGVGAILQRAGHGKSAGRPKPPLACRRWDARFLRYSGRSTAAIANDRCDINECVLSTLNCLSKEASEGLNLGVMRTVVRATTAASSAALVGRLPNSSRADRPGAELTRPALFARWAAWNVSSSKIS